MLFIEAPAGVGFSYSNVKSDYTVGDARTAADNLLLVLGFFQKFPALVRVACCSCAAVAT